MHGPDAPDRRWTCLASRVLVDRWWMRLRTDRVRLPSGAELEEFHVAEYPDWALALALTDDGEAVLVEQYRYGIDHVGLEFPAGAVAPGEDPRAAAERELLEETGFAARDWLPLGKLAVEPSRHTNYGHLFVARGACRVAEPQPDASEDLRVHRVPVGDLPALVAEGRIVHGMHVAALFWALHRGLLPTR